MVAASTIKDRSGNIIALRGTALTEKHISILKARGVQRVAVEGAAARDRLAAERLQREIDRRFSAAGTHAVMLKIRDIIRDIAW